ncbi:hypothetical protein BIW11_08459 [Tropilaelaps mercedesae]|uniref:LEM domain-containing protein n=1 Tax=Tropilaelaps mercedesae TaxID=418985 RepID=A0A1V9XPH9_9ACAR|nr:hypothetical protein BIW11_08459 [Tropilaelaps mercedesae]
MTVRRTGLNVLPSPVASAFTSEMSSPRMTKGQLREALSDIGVKTAPKMRKPELVKLYRKNVLDQNVSTVSPNDSLIGGFSSDEEEPMSIDTRHITNGTDVKHLTDDEIFSKLKDLGEHVGPILDSTRSIYERKLIRLLGGGDADGDKLDKSISSFSADEEEEEPDKEETDEYDVIGATGDNNEHLKSSSLPEKLLDDGGFLKTSSFIHEKVEQTDGNMVRTRQVHSVKTYTNETYSPNGKSFVPPPPKKRNIPVLAAVAILVLLIIAVLIWVNLEPGRQFDTVPTTAEVPVVAKVAKPQGTVAGATGGPPK